MRDAKLVMAPTPHMVEYYLAEDSNLLQYKGKKLSRSRRQTDMKFEPRKREGPFQNEPVPTVIFHGVKQVCSEVLLTNLVE